MSDDPKGRLCRLCSFCQKYSLPKFFKLDFAVDGQALLGEENPSSYWYWRLDISHLRLKESI